MPQDHEDPSPADAPALTAADFDQAFTAADLGLDLPGYTQWMAEQQAAAVAWRQPAAAAGQRSCCIGEWNGQHDGGCLFGARVRWAAASSR